MDEESDLDEDAAHLKRERKMFISPFTPAINPSSRRNSLTDWNENFQMPFSEYDKLIKSRNLPTFAADQVVHKPKYLPLPSFLQPKKAKPFQDFSTFMKEKMFTSKLPIKGRILSKHDQQVRNSFLIPPNQSVLDVPVQQDFQKYLPRASSVRRVTNEPKYLPLPPFLQPKKAKPFQDFSTFMKEMKLFTPKLESRILPEYKQPVKGIVISFLTSPKKSALVPVQNIMSKQDVLRDLPQTSSVRQVINEPKYLTLPPFYNFTTSKPLQESSATVQMSFSTSKFPHESTTLLEYKQPATNIFIPSSTPPNLFELTRPVQNNTSEQIKIFEDKSQTVKPYFDIPFNSTILLEYTQPVTNISIPNPTSSTHSELIAPVQNSVSKQENLSEDKSKTVKPFFGAFTDVNKKTPTPFEAFKNPTLQPQPETVQGQNRLTHKNISKSMPFNMSDSKMYSQSAKNMPLNVTHGMYNEHDKNFKTYNRTPSSPSSSEMNSTEMSSLQYLQHKLKQVKDIHDRKYYLRFMHYKDRKFKEKINYNVIFPQSK